MFSFLCDSWLHNEFRILSLRSFFVTLLFFVISSPFCYPERSEGSK